MGIQDRFVFRGLEASSARVFNICLRTVQIKRAMSDAGEQSEPDFLFNTHELNHSVLVKEARTDRKDMRYEYANAVGTKLYIPYNPERLYEGGKSAFLDNPEIERILRDHAGVDVNSQSAKVQADLKIIGLLDQIPSLDPFLVKDKLRIEGIEANEFYFGISEAEWESIQVHVSQKLKPIIDFAFQDSEELQRGRTMTLVNKLWDSNDSRALMPIIEAFNLPLSEAGGIFAAWKGIMYYDYEYSHAQAAWRDYGQWLENDAVPLDFVDPERKQRLVELIVEINTRFRTATTELRKIFSSYEFAYNALFVERRDPGPFIEFMRKAVEAYWILGTQLSAINHCVTVWDTLTARHFQRRLKYEQLFELLDLQRGIFAHS